MSIEIVPTEVEGYPGERVNLKLVNGSDGRCSFGTSYRLERKDGSRWLWCNPDQAFTAVELSLPAGADREFVVRVPDDAPPGSYRVVKSVCAASGVHEELSSALHVLTRG